MIKDEDENNPALETRVGRLFDDDDDNNQGKSEPLPAVNLPSPHISVQYKVQQLPAAVQPAINGTQGAADRKKALDRQLPAHDLDPQQCQSLTSGKEKKQLSRFFPLDFLFLASKWVATRG